MQRNSKKGYSGNFTHLSNSLVRDRNLVHFFQCWQVEYYSVGLRQKGYHRVLKIHKFSGFFYSIIEFRLNFLKIMKVVQV